MKTGLDTILKHTMKENTMRRDNKAILWSLVIALAVSAFSAAPAAADRVVATSFGMGALGAALGFAATGDPRWAAVGGMSGLAAGALIGQAAENSYAAEVAPPPPAAYYEPVPYPAYRYVECRTVRTVTRENGKVVRVVDREVCR
jgi:hypothetical protein